MPSTHSETLLSLSQIITHDPSLPHPNPTPSYWQHTPITLPCPPPPFPPTTDIAIIGSGITACSVAHHLLPASSPPTTIVVLEARKVTSGATGRNGGHIKATPELSYSALLPRIGKQGAREVVDFTLKNVRALLEFGREHGGGEVREVEALNVFVEREGFEGMKGVVGEFDEDNLDLSGRVRVVEREELRERYGIGNAEGAFSSRAGASWLYRLVAGRLEELVRGSEGRFVVYEDCPVSGIEFADGWYHVETPAGVVRAKKVVHATNGHAGHLLPGLRGTLFPVRGQMTAQTPTPAFGIQGHERSWSIHYPQGFDYITQSGETGEIFAGGGIGFSPPLADLGSVRDDETAVLPVAHLTGIMDAVFGFQVRDKVKAMWTGIMGFTADGLPLVGRLPKEATLRGGNEEWIAAGYNGYGMANAWLCGKHIAETLLGKEEAERIPSAYFITKERIEAAKDTIGTAERIMKLRGGT